MKIAILIALFVALGGCMTPQIDPELVYHCTFDSADQVISPKVGPAGSLREAVFKENEGRASLYVPIGAGVVDVPLEHGLPTDEGCIEFDAKILANKNYYVSGGDPRFFEIRIPHRSGWNFMALCDFNANNGGGNSGLYTQIGNVVMTSITGVDSRRPYSTVFWSADYTAWHHYTIRWNVKGVGGSSNLAEVCIDGRVITTESLDQIAPDAFRDLMSQSSVIHFANSFDTVGSGNCKTPFLLDDFKIWKTDRTAAR